MFVNLERTQASDDLANGQLVIITARWVLIAAGLMLALWNPIGLRELQAAIVLILGLAVANFALHTQVVTRGPMVARVVYAASAADLAVISLLIIAGGHFPFAAHVFYLPALLAISVTFRTQVTATYAAAAVLAYVLVTAAVAGSSAFHGAEGGVNAAIDALMMVGVAVCGNVYWRLERDRRAGVLHRTEREVASSPSAQAV